MTTKAGLLQPQGMTVIERDLLALAGADEGRVIFNADRQRLEMWNGTAWIEVLTETSNLNGANLSNLVQGNLLTGSVDGALLINQVDASLLANDVDGGTY